MSALSDHHVVMWFTTPEELRQLATEMEEFWKTCAPGHDKTVREFHGKSSRLAILVDQDKIKSPGWRDA